MRVEREFKFGATLSGNSWLGRCILLLTFLTQFGRTGLAQKQFNTWFFGEHAGFSFNSSPPQALFGGATNDWEGVCCISDPATGAILFYTNGETVWNRHDVPMPNGTGLFGNTSSEQSALALRSLVDTSIYYLFTVDQAGYFWPSRGLNYSIVDMRLDGGLGDVRCKNIHVLDDASEALQAIVREGDDGYWIVGHKMKSNTFFAYLLSEAGLADTPVLCDVGDVIGTAEGGICGIASSADGRAISLSAENLGVLQLFKFDPLSGLVSSPIGLSGLSNSTIEAYLGAFSNSGRYFYSYISRGDSVMAQFDLSVWRTDAIRQSMRMLSTSSPNIRNSPGALMAAPDGRIYTTNGRSNWLSVITRPELPGASANFIVKGVDLEPASGLSGLPSTPSSLLNKDWPAIVNHQVSIVRVAADTIGGSYFVFVRLSRCSHLAFHWSTDEFAFVTAFDSHYEPIAYRLSQGPTNLDLDFDNGDVSDTIILQFYPPTEIHAATFTIDSIESTIVPNCLRHFGSTQLNFSPPCGAQTIASFMHHNRVELGRIEYVRSSDQGDVVFKVSRAANLSVHYIVYDMLGRCSIESETQRDLITLHVAGFSHGMYFLRVSTADGLARTTRFFR
jgi:hypothetical protein